MFLIPVRIYAFTKPYFRSTGDNTRETRGQTILSQPLSINMEELTPLDLIFMQLREGGRQEFLELMFHVSSVCFLFHQD